jgi:hypothetical protein
MEAEPQEPVAWLKEWDSVGGARTGLRRVDLTPDCEAWLENMCPKITQLYTAPQAPKLEAEPVAIKTANGITLKAGWDTLPDGTELYAMEASK